MRNRMTQYVGMIAGVAGLSLSLPLPAADAPGAAQLPAVRNKNQMAPQTMPKLPAVQLPKSSTDAKSSAAKQTTIPTQKVSPNQRKVAPPSVPPTKSAPPTMPPPQQAATAPLPATKAPAVGGAPGLSGRAFEANQARGLNDMRNAGDALRNLPGMPERNTGIKPDLGLTRRGDDPFDHAPGGKHEGFQNPYGDLIPGMPSNQSGKQGGSPLTPSTNPANWMSGAAGQDSGGSNWVYDIARGGPVNGRDSQGRTHLYRPSDGAIRVLTPNPQGGSDVFEKSPTNDGGTHIYRTHRDADGNHVVIDEYFDSSGNRTGGSKVVNGEDVPDRPQSSEPKDGGLARTQDPDSAGDDGSWARWHAKAMGKEPDLSLKKPDLANPGPDGATPEPTASRLRPAELQLTGQPNPNEMTHGGAPMDAETAQLFGRKLRDKAQGGSEPPVRGPDGEPVGR